MHIILLVQDNVGMFTDLQEALNAAKDGTVIFLEKGFYFRSFFTSFFKAKLFYDYGRPVHTSVRNG